MGNWIKQIAVWTVVAAFCFTGCSKKQTVAPMAPLDVSGVKVDLPKLQADFNGAPPEAQALIADIGSSLRYGLYEKTLVALDKLSSTPGLTDPQKQTVNTVIEQMKQVIAKAGASR